jgi:hypothetical protein
MDMKLQTTPPSADHTPAHTDADVQLLDELRQAYDSLAAQVAAISEKPMAAIADATESLAQPVREQIKVAPLTSVILATLGGVALAIVLTSGTRKALTLSERALSYADAVGHIDVHPAMARLARATEAARHSASDAASGFIPNIEKLATSLSRIDTGGSVKGAIEQAVDWVRTSVSGKTRS